MKKLFLFTLTLIIALSLFACGKTPACESCSDVDLDGICDVCTNAMPANDIILFENNVPTFTVITSKDIDSRARYNISKAIKNDFKSKHDIVINTMTEGSSSDVIGEVEILIGNVASRGEEYFYDSHSLGKEGYIIKIVGKKIIINAGSEDALLEAAKYFTENILKVNESDHTSIKMSLTDQKYAPQDNYAITALKLNGEDMNGYTIVSEIEGEVGEKTATALQDSIYERAGYWFEIGSEAEKKIIIRESDGEGGFKVYTSGSDLVIESLDKSMTEVCVTRFVRDVMIAGSGELDLRDTVYTSDTSYVSYEDFGAAGDGVTDDFQVLYNTHVFANKSGKTVKATDGKTYYLHNAKITNASNKREISYIPIKTNVDWGNASFIIDDTGLNYFNDKTQAQTNIFVVESDYSRVVWNNASPGQAKKKLADLGSVGYSYNTTKLDLGLGYPAMLIIYDSTDEVYKRYGATYSGSGSEKHELIIIDENGNISPETPFMFDYEKLTKIEIINLSLEPLTIKGGNFTTIASRCDALKGTQKAGYYNRGIGIARSYVTLDSVNHYVTGEVTLEEFKNGLEGPHYRAFYYVEKATDITIQNCIITGRRYYKITGSYEFYADNANNIVLKNCQQCNFWLNEDGSASDTKTNRLSMDPVSLGNENLVHYCWGIGGTNFCKNLSYIDSRISRFDAHCGLYNGSIIGCEVNFIEIIGKGTFTVKDTTWYSSGSGATYNSLVYLRDDYGATWEGEFIFDNVTAYVSDGEFYLFRHHYNDWDFGYKCYLPSIEINGLKLFNRKTGEALGSNYSNLFLFTNKLSTTKAPYMHLDEVNSQKNNNPIGVPEYIKITSNENGYKFRVPYKDDPNFFFAGVKFYTAGKLSVYAKGVVGAFNFT